MNLLSLFKKRSTGLTYNDYVKAWLQSNRSKSGQIVTNETSFSIPVLWAGFRFLGQTMASLPLEVFRIEKDGSHVDGNHVLSELLGEQPNQMYNSYSWKEMMQVDLESYGNAYSRIYRDRNSNVTAIERIEPVNVEIKLAQTDEGQAKKYIITYIDLAGSRKTETVDHTEMIHLMIMSKDGIIGRSPVNACKESLGMMMAAQEYGSEFFAKGAQPSGVLSTEQKLTPDQVKEIEKYWLDNYQGSKNAGSVAVLHMGNKYQQISATPVDADFVKTMKWTAEQVCQILGIPPHLLGVLDRSTNNNIEQQSIDSVVHCIRPRARIWESELQTKLFLTRYNRKKYFIRFNLEGLLRGDVRARAEFYKSMWGIGALNADEARSLEGWNNIPGGKTYYVPSNYMPANSSPDKLKIA